MALISAEIPAEKIWLERLVQSANSMTLSGVALSNESIAEFMRNLESSPYVIKGTVNLTHSRQTLISNMKLREFQVSYQFVPFSQVQKRCRKRRIMNLDRFSLAALEEKVSSLTPQQRVLLFVGTFLFLGALFYFFQYEPQSEVIAGLQGKLAEQEKRLAPLKQAAAQLPALQEELAKAEEDFSRLLALLPDKKEIPALLDTISQLGAQVGLENILFQPQPEQLFEFYAMIPIRLDLVGNLPYAGSLF